MKDLIGYCGLDCELCEARTATINNDNELRVKTAKLWCEMNNTDQIKAEHINCLGCRVEGVKTYFCTCMCEVRKCCSTRSFETCAQCPAKAACDKAINDYCKLIWSELDTSIDRIVKQVTSKAQYEIEANQ